MPRYFIFVEIDNKTADHRLVHRVSIPTASEPGFYRAVSSYNAFREGKRKGSTKWEKEHYKDRCCYGPDCLYYGEREDQWLRDQERQAKHIPDLDDRLLPKIEHASIWDFYNHIGFDHTARKYTGIKQ